MPLLSRRDFFIMAGLFCTAPSVFALNVKGVPYISISYLAQMCGMRYITLPDKKSQRVYSKTTRMEFEMHSRMMSLNGITVWLGFPVVASKGMLHIAKSDYFKSISPILFPQNNGTPPKLFHIVIDAGHGGKDNGAINKRYKVSEKALNLDIATRIGRELKKNGYRVSFTRTRDEFIDLEDRPKRANSARADLMLSIHCNAAADNSISGIETFALTPRFAPSTTSAKASRSDSVGYTGHMTDEWNELLAYYIQRSLTAATNSPDRGVKRARFAVLRTTRMPATLIECGFISNNAECRRLITPAYRQILAESVARAIMSYHTTLRRIARRSALENKTEQKKNV